MQCLVSFIVIISTTTITNAIIVSKMRTLIFVFHTETHCLHWFNEKKNVYYYCNKVNI